MSAILLLDSTLLPPVPQVALIWATGLAPSTPSSFPPQFLMDAVRTVQEAGDEFLPTDLRAEVRNIIRFGKFRPSGRSKPASEFLLQAALADEFPSVSPLVDINNTVSLLSGYPASIFDADLTGDRLLLRRGEPGESYVFNQAGHEIKLEDLLSVCRPVGEEWEPCGNPVKDSMATKVSDKTRSILATLFAPAQTDLARLTEFAELYVQLLISQAGAESADFRLV